MKISQLKEWINTLTDDVMDYDVVTASIIDETDDEFSIQFDNFVTVISVDDENKHVLLINNETK